MKPTPEPEGYCDQLLQNQLVFNRGAYTTERMNKVVRQVQSARAACNAEDWNPQADDSTAAGRCWNEDMQAPIGLTHPSTGKMRVTNGRDSENNIIIYWSNEDRRPHDGAACWLYIQEPHQWG